MLAMTNQKQTLTIKYKRRLEVSHFWSLSLSIRRGYKSPEVVESEIVFYKRGHSNSQWFIDRLNMLQELNKARYSNVKEKA